MDYIKSIKTSTLLLKRITLILLTFFMLMETTNLDVYANQGSVEIDENYEVSAIEVMPTLKPGDVAIHKNAIWINETLGIGEIEFIVEGSMDLDGSENFETESYAVTNNAVIIDVISEEFIVDYSRFEGGVTPDGYSIDGNTVTINIGSVDNSIQNYIIPIKLASEDVPVALYRTNDSAELTYTDINSNVVTINNATSPSIESPGLAHDEGYVEIKYYFVNDEGQFINEDGEVVSKNFARYYVKDYKVGTHWMLENGTYNITGDTVINSGNTLYEGNEEYPISVEVTIDDILKKHYVEYLVLDKVVAREFTITYKDDDNTIIEGLNPNTYMSGGSSPIYLPIATMFSYKPGYTFKGFTATNNETDNAYIYNLPASSYGDKILYANWEKDASKWHNQSYEVDYYLDDTLEESKTVTEEILLTATDITIDKEDVDKTYENYSVIHYQIEGIRYETLPTEIGIGKTLEVYYQKDIINRPADIAITANAVTGEYNGKEYTLTVEGTIDGDTVWYLEEGGKDWTTTPPTVTNVNESTNVQVKVTNPAYNEVIINTSITVTPKLAKIYVDNTTIEYGETPTFKILKVEDVLDGDTLNEVAVYFEETVPTAINVYEGTITATHSNKNYEVSVVVGTLTITKISTRPDGAQIVVRDPDATYD